MKNIFRLLVAVIATGLILSSAEAQMEIRGYGRYNAATFLRLAPHAGEKAPELNVRTLSGEPVSLNDYLGKNVVVIKGGYT